MTPFPCVLFAKAPVPGQVKTRLCPPLTPAEAAAVAWALTQDAAGLVQSSRRLELVMAYSPDTEAPFFGEKFPGIRLLPQGEGDLGLRLDSAFSRVLLPGVPGALVLGSDHPTLRVETLELMLDALEKHDLCLLPTEDGGYAALGLRRLQPALFQGIPWSSPHVLSETLRKAESQNLSSHVLDPIYDLDRPEDLARLRGGMCCVTSGGSISL